MSGHFTRSKRKLGGPDADIQFESVPVSPQETNEKETYDDLLREEKEFDDSCDRLIQLTGIMIEYSDLWADFADKRRQIIYDLYEESEEMKRDPRNSTQNVKQLFDKQVEHARAEMSKIEMEFKEEYGHIQTITSKTVRWLENMLSKKTNLVVAEIPDIRRRRITGQDDKDLLTP